LSQAGIVSNFKKVSLTNFILKRCAGVSIPEGKKVVLLNELKENKMATIRIIEKYTRVFFSILLYIINV
jgi:hypothetical protein